MYYVCDVLQEHRYIHYIISFVAFATRVNRHVLYKLLSILLLYIITIGAIVNMVGVCDNPSYDEQKHIIIVYNIILYYIIYRRHTRT